MKGSFQKLRICKIYDGDYPWDVRVQKVMSTLVAQGYEVHLVCRNLGKRPTYEYLDKVHIHRLFPLRSHRLNSSISFPAPVNPLWLHTIRRVIRKIRADLIIVRDLPLTLAAIFMGRAYHLPIIFDMAENYPAMVLDIWRFGRFKASNLIARNPLILRSVEALSVRGVDKILAVVEESKSRLLRQYSISESKIRVVSNTPRLSDLSAKIHDTAAMPDRDGSLKLIFIGGLESGRNLEVILRGMAICGGKPDCSLTILGRGNGEVDLRRLVDKLNLNERVDLKGWVNHESIGEVLMMSDIGIIPHPKTRHTNTTVPNKLFDYMAYKKPVLASDTEPVRRIVQSENCGLIYRHDSPQDFRDKLQRLIGRETREAMGANGRKAVEKQYNWEADSKELLAAVQELSSQARANSSCPKFKGRLRP